MIKRGTYELFGKQNILAALERKEAFGKLLFVGQDIGVTYRTINHWDDEGLVADHREEGQRWRRFHFVDFVWLKLLDQFRVMGLPIEDCREAMRVFLDPMGGLEEKGKWGIPQEIQKRFQEAIRSTPNAGEFSLLELLISATLDKRRPIRICIFQQGGLTWVVDRSENDEVPAGSEDRISFESHFSASITGIIRELLAGKLALKRVQALSLLQEKETKLLLALHSGTYNSVKIKFRDKKTLDLPKDPTTISQVVDAVTMATYKEIELVQDQGQNIKIKQP